MSAINTIKGNVNWMRARQHKLIETLFGEDQHKVFQLSMRMVVTLPL
ncbi:hypothetical protein ACVNPX_07905 [Staphylococcus aureus]